MDTHIKSALDNVTKWDISAFERKGKDFNFTDIFPLVQRIHQALLDFRSNPDFWSQLPKQRQTEIFNTLPQLIASIEKMRGFNPEQSNPSEGKRSIVDNINSQYNTLYPAFFQPLDIFMLNKRFKESDLQVLNANAKQILDEVKKSGTEAKQVLEGMRSLALKESTAVFADIFEKQAKRNRNVAIIWLLVAFLSAAAIMYFVWQHFIVPFDQYAKITTTAVPAPSPTTGSSSLPDLMGSLPVVLSKFIFISLVTAFFYQIVKNMNSNMHLFTLNRHKANCLRTMKALQEASADVRTREVVLMQATKAIFELNETGFISSKEKEITGLESIRVIDQIKPT